MKEKLFYFFKYPLLIYFSIFILTILGFYLRIQDRASKDLWDDETYALDYMGGSLWDFIGQLPQMEFSSYLSGDYYLLFPFFKLFGVNKWGLAIPHIISTIFCYYFLYLICRLHMKSFLGYLIAFSLVSFNATLINHSFELRYYAVLQTAGLAAYYFTYQLSVNMKSLTKIKLMLIVLFFILLMLFHIYSILIITLSIAYFLALNIQKPSFPLVAKNIFKSFSFVFLITAPLIWLVYSGEHISSETLWSHTLIFQWIPNPLVDLTGFLKGVFCNIIGNRYLYLLFPGLLISLVLPHNERGKQFWFFFLLIMMPVLLLLILVITRLLLRLLLKILLLLRLV